MDFKNGRVAKAHRPMEDDACALLRADQRLTEGLRKAGVPEGKAKAN
jgi:hypothetical protein